MAARRPTDTSIALPPPPHSEQTSVTPRWEAENHLYGFGPLSRQIGGISSCFPLQHSQGDLGRSQLSPFGSLLWGRSTTTPSRYRNRSRRKDNLRCARFPRWRSRPTGPPEPNGARQHLPSITRMGPSVKSQIRLSATLRPRPGNGLIRLPTYFPKLRPPILVKFREIADDIPLRVDALFRTLIKAGYTPHFWNHSIILVLPIGPDLAHKAGPPIGGIFTTFGRGRGLNFRVKFLGGVRVRVGFFMRG